MKIFLIDQVLEPGILRNIILLAETEIDAIEILRANESEGVGEYTYSHLRCLGDIDKARVIYQAAQTYLSNKGVKPILDGLCEDIRRPFKLDDIPKDIYNQV
jgi:hypothetical protein